MMRSCASVERAFHRLHIVKIFLDDDIAAAGKGGVLFANERGLESEGASWILGAVDETDKVAIVEVTEALNLVGS